MSSNPFTAQHTISANNSGIPDMQLRRRSIYETSVGDTDSLSSHPQEALSSNSGSMTSVDDIQASVNEKQDIEYNPPPDGGYGWVIVACSFLLEFFAEGPVSAFGVFQEYYVNERFSGQVSNATISLVGVLSSSCMAILGVVSGKLCERYGYRLVPMCGIVTLSLGYLLASFATKPWHLLLTQGVLCGIGASLTFLPAVVVPSQWFEKRRGLASGTVNMGIGVGGLVWTQFNHLMIRKFSVAWTLRLTAIVVLVTCTSSLMLIKTYKVSPNPRKIGLKQMNDRNFIVFMIGSFFTGVASLIPFYYLPAYASDIGISSNGGALITSIANAASLTGRLIATLVSDRVGPVFILLCAYTLTSSSILLIWTTTQNFSGTMVFGIIFGLGYGAIFTQTSAFIAKYFGVDTLPVFVGLYYTISGIGYMFGPPIAGIILEKTRSWNPPYIALKIYAGVPMIIACMAIVIVWTITRTKKS